MEKDIEQRALRLLGMREYSRKELRYKLCDGRADPNQVDQVLDGLVDKGLLSEARFSEQYVESRCKRGYGPVRIRAELQEKGIDETLIDARLDELSDEWLDHLRAVHDKKYGSESPSTMKELARRARFLLNRGFESGQVRQFLSRNFMVR